MVSTPGFNKPKYRFNWNKRRGASLIFRSSSAALAQGRCLFANWTQLAFFLEMFICYLKRRDSEGMTRLLTGLQGNRFVDLILSRPTLSRVTECYKKKKFRKIEDGKLLDKASTSLLNKAFQICSNINCWFQIPLTFFYVRNTIVSYSILA